MSDLFTHSIDIPVNHPCFEGHFPDFPVFPAVGQLTLLTEAISMFHGGPCVITSIPVAKFLSPLGPGVSVTIELQHRGENNADFVIISTRAMVAKGMLTYRIVKP